MWRTLLVLLTFVVVSECFRSNNDDDNYVIRRKQNHHHCHHLLYGGGIFTYLTFLAIKVKIALVIGAIIIFVMFAGKLFAIIKYGEYMKDHYHHPHDHHEYYREAPTYEHGHSFDSEPSFSSIKSLSGGHSFSYSGPPDQSFPPGFSVDSLPPNAAVTGSGSGGPPDGSQYSNGPPGGLQYGPPDRIFRKSYKGGRSSGGNKIYEKFNVLVGMIRRLNLTDMAFDTMKISNLDCRKKFVCEADFYGNKSVVLKTSFDMLSEENYKRYKTNREIKSADECSEIYQGCKEKMT